MKKGDSKFKEFIKKAGGVFPEILGAAVKLGTGDIGGAMNDVAEMLGAKSDDDDIETRNKARELLQEFELKKMEFELEFFKEGTKDAQNARDNETKRDISHETGFLTKNIHELIAIVIVGAWIVSWYVVPEKDQKIVDVVMLILGYLYGRTRPQ